MVTPVTVVHLGEKWVHGQELFILSLFIYLGVYLFIFVNKVEKYHNKGGIMTFFLPALYVPCGHPGAVQSGGDVCCDPHSVL